MADISLKDIAKKAGVSVGTVDRVIHNRGNVSTKSRNKVLEVLQEVDYKPNLMARGLANKHSYKIAALLPHSNTDPFWKQPNDGIRKAIEYIKSFGFSVDIYNFTDGVDKELYNVGMKIFDQEYHALLVAPIIRDEAMMIFDACEKNNIPYVQINTYIHRDSNLFLSYIGQDSYSSGKLAAKLLDFGTSKGDTILILHLEREVYNSEHLMQKERGFRDYFKTKKDKNIKIEQLTFSDLDSDQKKDTFVKYALKQYPQLTGVFITTSKLHRVISEFTQQSKHQINFIGYDLIDENLKFLNNETAFFLINQNPTEQGHRGIMTLYNFLLHKTQAQKIQYLPIDVVMKENMEFYVS